MNQVQEVVSAQLALLVRKQLGTSIHAMQAVLQDPKITNALVSAAECTAEAMQKGRKLMVAGNGGSAAGSQHLVAEFVSRLTVDRRALPAIALTVDTSILTAIGNDYDYQNVFERQIEALGQSGDVFLVLSTSGNSKNILKGLVRARAMDIKTIGFSGNSGGSMAELCDYSIVIPSNITMNIQECHLALEHIFSMLVEKLLFGIQFGSK
jgi:D-sedoheptulose 7-phosphate isomerase